MRGSITGTGLIALALTFACARRSPEAAAVPDRPALRVERLAPRVGGGLDSATVLSAHIWYYIPAPDFEPGRYSILVVFQSNRGYRFNRAPGTSIGLTQPTGVVEFSYPLSRILDDPHLAQPVTAYFYLRRSSGAGPVEAAADSFPEDPGIAPRAGGPVIASSEPLFFGGNEPADDRWTTLRKFGEVLTEYMALAPRRALALVRDSSGRFSYGYGHGYRTAEAAVDRAMHECDTRRRDRNLQAPCEVFAIDSKLTGLVPPTRLRLAAPADAPQAVARAFFDALESERWIHAARLIDPTAVQRFHRERTRALAFRLPERMTVDEIVEQMIRRDPDMPREVAEYQARKTAEAMAERGSFLTFEFARVQSIEEVLRLSPVELTARRLEAKDPRYRFARSRQQARARFPDRVPPEALDTNAPSVRHTITGSVAEGDSLAYVVYRFEQAAPRSRRLRSVSLLPLRLTPAGWRVVSPDVAGTGSYVGASWGYSGLEGDGVPPP